MYGLVVSHWHNFQTSFHVGAWSHQKKTQWNLHCGVLRQAVQNAAYGHTKNLPTFLVDLLFR